MQDAAVKEPASRYSVEERIGVLEELLGERYSCRAFLPQPVPRATIDRILTAAQKTASWCNSQPWQLSIASGAATRKFRDVDLWRRQQRQAEQRRLSVPARISRRLSGAPPRKRLPALQFARHPARRQGGLCQAGARELQFLRRAACRHRSYRRGARRLRRHRLRRLCQELHAGRAGSGSQLRFRRRHWRFTPRWCASISASAMTGGWYAAFHLDFPTASTRPTVTAPRGHPLRIPSRSSMNSLDKE